MKRKIVFVILLIFYVVSLIAMWPRKTKTVQQVLSRDLEKSVTTEGNVETTEYFLNGVLTYASDLRYARAVKTTVGSETITEYFNEKGEPCKQSAGHYALKRLYENGQNTRTVYLDKYGQPMKNSSGYTTLVRVYEGSLAVREYYLDPEGKRTANSSGVFERKNEYDEFGNNTVISYYDADGKLKNISSGYAVRKRSFYTDGPYTGKLKTEEYYDKNGDPTALSYGQYGIFREEYDEYGRTVKNTYLTREGGVLFSVVYTYFPDDSMESERYFDAEGKPYELDVGHYGRKRVNGKYVYLNSRGKPIFDLNRYLHNYPLMVMLIGTALILVSVFVPRRINVILLILYTLFILYMTLWDRSGESRANLRIFWSYRQFISSESLRLEILDNIWLFVPFGAVLYRLQRRKWVLFLPLVFSLGIEAAQYVTGFGLCELDDVISNTMGGMIGFMVGWLINVAISNKNKQTAVKETVAKAKNQEKCH